MRLKLPRSRRGLVLTLLGSLLAILGISEALAVIVSHLTSPLALAAAMFLLVLMFVALALMIYAEVMLIIDYVRRLRSRR